MNIKEFKRKQRTRAIKRMLPEWQAVAEDLLTFLLVVGIMGVIILWLVALSPTL